MKAPSEIERVLQETCIVAYVCVRKEYSRKAGSRYGRSELVEGAELFAKIWRRVQQPALARRGVDNANAGDGAPQ